MEFWQKIIDYSSKHNIPMKYYFLADEAKSSSYKDSYIFHAPKVDEKEGEREASEQIVLFDNKGNGEELANISQIINGIRNKNITIVRYFMPEELRKDILGG